MRAPPAILTAGGTDLNAYVGTLVFGRRLFSDVDMVVANKNGAFGAAELAFSGSPTPYVVKILDGGVSKLLAL